MIKYNGYYRRIFPTPKPYVDYAAGNNKRTGVFHNAYLFLENGIIKRKSIKTQDVIPVLFKKEDFEIASLGEFSVKEDILTILFDKGQMWELKEIFKFVDDQIVCIESNSTEGIGVIYQYQTWNEQ